MATCDKAMEAVAEGSYRKCIYRKTSELGKMPKEMGTSFLADDTQAKVTLGR